MKTKLSSASTLLPFLAAVATQLMVAANSNAAPAVDYSIIISEISPTELKAIESDNGAALTVTLNSTKDIWTVTLPYQIVLGANNKTYFSEPNLPRNITTDNKLIWGPTSLSVFSDVGFDANQPNPHSSGAIVALGADPTNKVNVSVQFFDFPGHDENGNDQVPDSGQTGFLLILASGVLVLAARRKVL
jgi:hypothetical protein